MDAPPISWLTEVYCKPQSNGCSMILFGSTMDWFKRHFDIKPWFVVNHEGVLYICRPILAWWGYYGPKTHQTHWRQNIWNNWLGKKGLAYESQAMTSLKGKSWGKASEKKKNGWTPPSSSIIAIVEMALYYIYILINSDEMTTTYNYHVCHCLPVPPILPPAL